MPHTDPPTERPLVLNDEMVRAVLQHRKRQTRRVARLTDAGHVKAPNSHKRWHPDDPDAVLACPFGLVGDVLWVREAWRLYRWTEGEPFLIEYRADAGVQEADSDLVPYHRQGDVEDWYERMWMQVSDELSAKGIEPDEDDFYPYGTQEHLRWRPSIQLPRWAARLTLTITDVRLERLHAITEDDAQAEGVERPILHEGPVTHTLPDGRELRGHPWTGEYRDAFEALWLDLYDGDAQRGWNANPLVWAVTFTMDTPKERA